MNEQDRLLLLIEERCSPERYFVIPTDYNGSVQTCRRLQQAGLPAEVWVRGGGLASRYAALVRKGLIEEVRTPDQFPGERPRGYRITDHGKLRTQSLV